MSISSSLAAGVSGLNANSQKLASISDNISNASTFGYKRSVTDFHSMVVASGGNKYTAGGVTASSQKLIDQRGQLQSTDNPTDVAISGRGFFPVTDIGSIGNGGGTKLALTTTGSFRPNADGVLVNATGKVLLGWPANVDGTFGNPARDSVDGLKPVNVYHNQFASNPTTEMTLAVNLPSDDADVAPFDASHGVTIEYFGTLGQTEKLNFTFEPAAENTWTMSVTDKDGAAVGTPKSIVFDDEKGTGGQILTVDGAPYEPIELARGDGQNILLNFGDITQLDTGFAPSQIVKNGSSVGNFAGVEIAEDGVVHAIYDTGFTRPIYQVPVVDVPNPNGLKAGDDQTYEVTLDSGGFYLWDAGSGPVGSTMGYTREGSTTDVAHELTQLITTQRAYSSSAKIIQTVDEMLQETMNLKR